MLKKVFFIAVICLFYAEIATAQSSQNLSESSCPLESGDSQNNILSQNSDRVEIYSQDENTLVANNILNKAQLPEEKHNNTSNQQISINTFQNSTANNNSNAVNKRKISVARISVPSLWWAKEQFDPFSGRLIDSWLAYPQIKQIDLTVNWQLWTLLDYLGRYRLINQLGTVVREHGYELRVFNQQQRCLALYRYNNAANPPKWEIKIEGIGQDSLQVKPAE